LTGAVLALALLGVPAGVHADEDSGGSGQIRWGKRHWLLTGSAAMQPQPNDPIHIEGYQTAFYYECTEAPTVPSCWLVSRLNFWASIDLGYRRHGFKGRTSINRGSDITWSAWTNKRHRMQCVMGSGTCGVVRRVPTGKFWSDRYYYRTTRFPNPGRFRFSSSACAHGNFIACGVGRTVTPPIRCDHREEQCYFDVG
jgi:hypothetical protein